MIINATEDTQMGKAIISRDPEVMGGMRVRACRVTTVGDR